MTHKILIVDDDPVIVEVFKKVLTNEGYDVCSAQDGHEGLKRVEDCRPDLIILDVLMPSMDGYAFIRALKGLKTIAREEMVPVIVATVKEGLETTFKLEGVKEYLVKPIKLSELICKVNECLESNG